MLGVCVSVVQSWTSLRAGMDGVTGHFFFRPFVLSYIDMRSAHLFHIERSPSMLDFAAEKRIIDYAVARSISAVYQFSSGTPV